MTSRQRSLFDEGDHTCHARGCEVRVKPEFLMCGAHWRKVSYKIKRDVWNAYRPGQCDDKRPSEAWQDAASAAIAYVACLEGQGVTKREAKVLAAYGGQETELLITATMKRLGVAREVVEGALARG